MGFKRLCVATVAVCGLSLFANVVDAEESFDGADERSKKLIADADKSDTWVVVSDDERATTDAAVATGLQTIFKDDASRGISNAEEIYNALNN